jgi:hypothetical protein
MLNQYPEKLQQAQKDYAGACGFIEKLQKDNQVLDSRFDPYLYYSLLTQYREMERYGTKINRV